MSGALHVRLGRKTFTVASLEDAAAKWNAFRDEVMYRDPSRAGCSSLGNGIVVKDASGKEAGRVSYNGRIWPAGPQELAS